MPAQCQSEVDDRGHSSICKKLYAKGKVGWKWLAPKWTQLATSEASVASPMIIKRPFVLGRPCSLPAGRRGLRFGLVMTKDMKAINAVLAHTQEIVPERILILHSNAGSWDSVDPAKNRQWGRI